MGYILDSIAVGPLQTNCYLVACPKSKDAIIIDPGGDFEVIRDRISAQGLAPKLILNTHAHFDHIGAVSRLKEHYGIKFGLHEEEIPVLESAPMAKAMFGLADVTVPKADFFIKEGDSFDAGEITLEVLETPGHTRGGVCFLGPDFLISGDTLFQGSIGRTDLPGGSFEAIMESINKKLLVLGDDIWVYPGHGERTSIGAEKISNPYLK